MKKLASVLLVVKMVFGLVACGSQEKNQENNKCNKKNRMASNIINGCGYPLFTIEGVDAVNLPNEKNHYNKFKKMIYLFEKILH